MVQTHSSTLWFPRGVDNPDVAIRLLCFPHAGGGSAAYFRLKDHLGNHVELVPARFPGREGRFQEAPFDALDALLETLGSEVRKIIDEPYALLGHSLGAYVAFELARLLKRDGLPAPAYLFVVAAQAPQLPPQTPFLHVLSDDELHVQLRLRYGEMPAGTDERLFRLLLPTLRADLKMVETYQYRAAEPLDCPILAIGGRDDQAVQPTGLAGWREQTTVRFSQRTIAGGHFLFNQSGPQVMQLIGQKLNSGLSDKAKRD